VIKFQKIKHSKTKKLKKMKPFKIRKDSIINRDEGYLDKYLLEIGKENLLTLEEEAELAKKIRAGDEMALEKLVKANLRFVVSVAQRYQNKGLSLPDLINEGNYGMIKAAQCFDETRKVKFISYAVWWVRQSILEALAREGRIVRLPTNQIGLVNKVKRAFCALEQKLQREPTVREIAEAIKLTEDDVRNVLLNDKNGGGSHQSLDKEFEDSDESLANYLEGEDETDAPIMSDERKDKLMAITSQLPPKERMVIEKYYGLIGLPKALKEIAEDLNWGISVVRTLQEKGFRRMRLMCGVEF
jgi:RNA polymerase primary sigma factor